MIVDAETRDKARRNLAANVVVEAGAGTGKTTLLTDRLMFLLLAGGAAGEGVDIRRVVALTFTEKAAGEIRVRLSMKLGDLLAVLDGRPVPETRRRASEGLLNELSTHFGRAPGQIRTAAEEALQNLDRAVIGTIHYFAALILRLHPLEGRVDPGFEVDAGPVFDEFFAEEWAAWLDEELGAEAPRAEAWLEVLQWAPLADLERVARALCQEGMAQGRTGATPTLAQRLKDITAAFARLPEGKPAPKGGSRITESIARASAQLAELARVLEAGGTLPSERTHRDVRPMTWPKAWEGMEGEALYRRGVRLAQETSAETELLVRKSVDLVRPFTERFRERYARRGSIGFDGLLTHARALVRRHPQVRQALKARFDAFLIDEFQDTDPLQGELLLFLAEAVDSYAEEWNAIRFGPGRLFLVGDPKQSIYRFRGADIRAYDRFTALALGQGAEKCNLQANFRSRAGLLSFVNAVGGRLMTRAEGYQPDYLPIFPGAEKEDAGGPCVELALVDDGEGEDRAMAEASVRAEARWTAEWIAKHAGPAEDGAARRYRYKDVAILLRSSTPVAHYLDALKGAGLPYVVEADRSFYVTPEVIDFANLLRTLDDPYDRVSLAGLLRSPLVGVPDRDLYALARAEGLSYLSDNWREAKMDESTRRRTAAFFDFLRRARDRAAREPLADFIPALLQESFLLEACTAAYQNEQTLANLLKFGRLAAEAGDARGATLKEFIRAVLREMDRPPREGESPLADEHLDAVRVLTMHKSKGLEFPVVILPNLAAKRGGGMEKPAALTDWSEGVTGLRLPQAKAADAAMALLEEDEERRQEYEQARLLYVALTRAREKMILLGRVDGVDASSFAALLRRAGAWPAKGERPDKLILDGVEVPVTFIGDDTEAGARRSGETAARKIVDAAGLAAVWRRRAEEEKAVRARPVFTSPTAYLTETRGPPRSSAAGTELAALVGQACHRILEAWDFKNGGDLGNGGNLLTRIESACGHLSAFYPHADCASVAREAQEILENFLRTPAAQRLGEGEILGREMPFLYSADGQVMRGSLDVLYRHKGVLWVADYKTDRVTVAEAKARAATYEPQGRAYAEAVRRTLGEACRFQVIFLRSGEVVDLF